jgi:hypothetical protein
MTFIPYNGCDCLFKEKAMKSCNTGPYSVAELVEAAYNDYICNKYDVQLHQDGDMLINGVYYSIVKTLDLKEDKEVEEITRVLKFVFSHNNEGLTDQLLPKDGYHFRNQEEWILKRIQFLYDQPALPISMSQSCVMVSKYGKDLEKDVRSFQGRINHVFLKKAPSLIADVNHSCPVFLLMATVLLTSALFFGYIAAVVMFLGILNVRMFQYRQQEGLEYHYRRLSKKHAQEKDGSIAKLPVLTVLAQDRVFEVRRKEASN